jgi:hypothetical protein
MRVTGGEEAGGSDLAPGRNKIENSATMQPDLRCSFIAEGYGLSPGNEGHQPKLRRTDLHQGIEWSTFCFLECIVANPDRTPSSG